MAPRRKGRHARTTDNVDHMVRFDNPNSRHTVNLGGQKYELKQVTASFLNPGTRLMVAPGSPVNPRTFLTSEQNFHQCRLAPEEEEENNR